MVRFSSKFLVALLTSLVLLTPAKSEIVFPKWKLTKQFASNANVFTTTDPNSGALTPTSATGKDQGRGQITIALTNGFTAPVTLTAYYWHPDELCWIRIAPSATSSFYAPSYSQAIDTNYATWQFQLPPQSIFIIMSSAAITGDVWTDATYAPQNPNHVN